MKLRTLDNDIASMLHHAYAETETFTLKGSGITANFVAVRLNSEPCRLGTGRWYTYLDLEQVSEAEVDKPKDWNGEGLPPVGTVCEFRRTMPGATWNPATILCVGEKRIFFRDKDGDELSRDHGEVEFRTTRTPEQIAAEERENELNRMVATVSMLDKGWAGKVCAGLYDAGYRKKDNADERK
jgi:hypothetical protein